MKVVFLSTLFRDPATNKYRGGGEISNRILFESIAEEHDVYIVSALGHSKNAEKINGVTYLCLNAQLKLLACFPLAGGIAKILFKSFALRACQKINPDVVISGTLEPSIANKIKRVLGCKAGIFIRAYENFGNNKTIKDWLRCLLYGDTKVKAINSLDFIITNSDFMLSRCNKEFDTGAVYAVYPPVDFAKSRADSAISKSLTHILAVSGTEKKGKRTILHLAKAFPDINFVILGYHHADESDYTQYNNVTLIKWLSEPAQVIQSYDLVIVPSLWDEPFGRIVVETLQLGRLVLVSDKGGLPETVCNSSRFIIPHDDPEAWVKRIKDIQQDTESYIEGSKALSDNAMRYSLEQQRQNFLKTLHKIVFE